MHKNGLDREFIKKNVILFDYNTHILLSHCLTYLCRCQDEFKIKIGDSKNIRIRGGLDWFLVLSKQISFSTNAATSDVHFINHQ